MKIKLTEKYRPFSHEAGTALLLPNSPWKVTAYPARLVLENLISIGDREIVTVLPRMSGLLESFTVMQDLEQGRVRIFGLGKEGYFSYRLVASGHEIVLFVERCPAAGLFFDVEGEIKNLNRKEELIVATMTRAFSLRSSEKIHFGSSKKQDWSLVKRRLNLEEILPIWFQLGKRIPEYPILDIGTCRYLKMCADYLAEKNRDRIGQAFIALFRVGFEGILSPRLIDTDYRSHPSDQVIPKEASPLLLVGEGARLIRKFLIEVDDREIALLPCLPKEIHCGRFVGIECHQDLSVDLEWSKKLIRRLIVHPKRDRTVTFTFQRPITSFRLRTGRRGSGKRLPVTTPLELKKDRLYILDRFRK
ncbi:MAG: glycoside hydrolase family 95-like protein [Chlamydiota bacterium]